MIIVFLSDDFPPTSFGGAGRIAEQLASGFCNRGHVVTVITTTAGRTEEQEHYKGYRVIRLPGRYSQRWQSYRGLWNWKTVPRLRTLLQEINPDVTHAHNIHFFLSYGALGTAKRFSGKVILTAHDAMSFHYGKLIEGVANKHYHVTPWQQLRRFGPLYNPFRTIVIRMALRNVTTLLVVSSALRDALTANGIRNATVCHNGIDPQRWQIAPSSVEQFRAAHGLAGKKVVLFGGRLSGEKGGKQILHALHAVKKRVPNALLLVLGKQEGFATVMRQLAETLGVADALRFTGWIAGDDLVAAYHASDVVTVPSIYLDPFPTVNLEAMACAKPVVGTCFGGTPEAVDNGVTGYIVNPRNTDDLAEKIASLLLDAATAKQFGRAGRQRIEKHFLLSHQLQALEQAYR